MTTKQNKKPMDRPEVELDTQTTGRVVSSVVLRGDISALNAEERSRYYVQMCESLGLSPAAQPFSILKLNGKEVLYPTRGATDQLAAIHRINREIVDGPRVVDLAGSKLVYAVCKATHPNGRVETAVATVPLSDPVNVLMKCETKAKRRATLSLLGLGMLDETELETIPAHAKEAARPIDLPGGGRVGEEFVVSEVAQAATQATAAAIDRETAQPEELPPTLAKFTTDLEQIELPGEAVEVWIKHRGDIFGLNDAEKETAWRMLCRRTEEVGKMKNAKAWLRRAIAEEELRRARPENNQQQVS